MDNSYFCHIVLKKDDWAERTMVFCKHLKSLKHFYKPNNIMTAMFYWSMLSYYFTEFLHNLQSKLQPFERQESQTCFAQLCSNHPWKTQPLCVIYVLTDMTPLCETAHHCVRLLTTAWDCSPLCETAHHFVRLLTTAWDCSPLRETAHHCVRLHREKLGTHRHDTGTCVEQSYLCSTTAD